MHNRGDDGGFQGKDRGFWGERLLPARVGSGIHKE